MGGGNSLAWCFGRIGHVSSCLCTAAVQLYTAAVPVPQTTVVPGTGSSTTGNLSPHTSPY